MAEVAGQTQLLRLLYVAGDRGVTWNVAADRVTLNFPVADRGVLLSYGAVGGH